MYVHPDKNPNEKEKAQIAFEGTMSWGHVKDAVVFLI